MNTKRLVIIGLLIALEIVLTRFLSIQTEILRISFGFIPIVMIAVMFGPVYAGIGNAVADVLGFMLWPMGTFFPGFTLSAFLVGIIYGFFLYEKPKNLLRISSAVIVAAIFVSLLLNTIWLSIIIGQGFFGILATRVVAQLLIVPIQIICIRFITSKHAEDLLYKRIILRN